MGVAEQESQYHGGSGQSNIQVLGVALESAERTLQEDKDFKSKALKRLRIEPNVVKTSLPELEKQIQAAHSPRREASIFLQAAGNAHTKWEEKGQTGSRRVGHRVQDFVTKFAGFVRVYAGFVDLIRQSNGGYAEVAYSTLSLFFMVAINKSENDTKFAATLEELQNSFPRMTMVEELYPEASVKQRVAEVYSEVVLFARACFKYFTDKSWRRLAGAIVSPAAVAVDKAAEKIHSRLAEVNAQIGILLHQRVHQIAETNKDISNKHSILLTEISMLQTKNSRLLTEMEDLQIKNDQLVQGIQRMEDNASQELLKKDRENLEDIRRMLGDIPSEYEDYEFCKKVLFATFPAAFGTSEGFRGWSERYIQMTWELLDASFEYQQWRNCPSPCLLVLGGLTESEGQACQSTCSWLSPASLHVVQNLVAQKRRVAFFSCHPGTRSRHVSSRLVVSSLLSKILGWQSNILRNRVKEFESSICSGKWDSRDQDEALQCQFGLLEQTVKKLPAQEEIFIILDRIDLCEYPKHNILAALQLMIKNSNCQLKVVAFMERVWDINDRHGCRDLVTSNKVCRTFGKMNWDQQRLSS